MSRGLLRHYVLTLYRTLTRHRLYAALNVLGLAVGIAVFLVLLLDVRFETSFDRWIPGATNVYRVDETKTFPGRAPEEDAAISALAAPLLKADYPSILAATRMVGYDERVSAGSRLETESVYLVDPDFFRVFPLPLIGGSVATALSAPDDLAISERIARKYFGSVDVIGRRLTLRLNHESTAYVVTAVFRDLPTNTHLKLDVVALLTPTFVKASGDAFDRWGYVIGPTYLRFGNMADARAVAADLDNFVNRRAAGPDNGKTLGAQPTRKIRLHLTPLAAIHFKDATISDAIKPGVDARTVASLGAVGGLTLAIAILNYVNLATAQAASRARELAMRKVLGATRTVLVWQMLAESTIVALIAVAAGAALAEAALPLVNAIGGSALSLRYVGAGGVGTLLLALTVLVGLLAGAYPALLLSGSAPAPVLSASRAPGGGRLGSRVRSALVLLQFAAAIGFTVAALVLYAQDRFVRNADLGFRRNGLILVDSLSAPDLAERQGAVLAALRAVPGVERVTISPQEPNTDAIYTSYAKRPGAPGPAIDLQYQAIGADYWSTYGVELIAGRTLDGRHGLDDLAGVDPKSRAHRGFTTMINEAAVKALGFATPQNALSKIIEVQVTDTDMAPATIVGEVRNIRFQSPRVPIGPAGYMYESHDVRGGVAAVRYQGVTASQMMARLRVAWEDVVPDYPFDARTANSRLADYYRPDEQRAGLFTLGAAIAVAVACLGLYGLAAFTTASRTREVGIRKTLGASTADVLALLVRQFLRPVLLANLIAWPLAWLAMRQWLQGFDQRIALGPEYFLAATGLTLIIALATVAGQAFAVARAEPAKALRHE